MSDSEATFVEEIVEAHGGRCLWDDIEWLEADLSVRGFLLTAKHTPALSHIRVRASTRTPHFFFYDFPDAGQTGEFLGNEAVRILGSSGEILKSRSLPRTALQGMRRNFWWDHLDFIYFGGYATWNYLSTPFLFLRDGFTFEYLGQRRMPEAMYFCLRVTFPDDLPTHCRTQTFYFDEGRLLRRLDYTAEVVGRWAHAAHFCDEYRDFSGLKIPTRRRVRPLLMNRTLDAPTLVAIDIHDIRLRRDA